MWKLVSGTLAALLMTAPGEDPAGKKHDRATSTAGVLLAFKDLDANSDGKVAKEEFMEAFRKLDRDQDGFLSAQELSGSGKPGPQSKHGKMKSGKGRGKH